MTQETVTPRGRSDLRPPELDGLVETLQPLSEPNRLRIVALLTRAELCVCDIAEVLGLRQSLVSNHLRVLRRIGLVRARRDESDNRWVYYSLNLAKVEQVRAAFASLLDVSQMAPEPADCAGRHNRRGS